MRLAALIPLFLALPLAAQDSPGSTIQAQINAFLADDLPTAFGLASPNIQGLFGTPDNFGAMVRQGYPMVYRPADVQMLNSHERGGTLWQKVLVRDANGRGFVLDYQMVETPDGWRINAVELLEDSGLGA